MKKTIIAFSLILFAVIGAYATAQNTRLVPVFYTTTGSNCLEGTVEAVCPDGQFDCLRDVTPAAGGPTVSSIIYEDIVAENQLCIDPYPSNVQP